MGRQRKRERPRTAEPEVAPQDPLVRLRGLLRAVGEAKGDARVALAAEINRVLAKIRLPGNESDEAGLLVAELDKGAFDDLIDASGVSSRKEAVQTLLSLGFPHALKVDPDDLDFARKDQTREKDRQSRAARLAQARQEDEPRHNFEYDQKLKTSRRIAAALAALSSLVLLVDVTTLMPHRSLGVQLLGLFQALCSVGSTAYLAAVMPPLEKQAVPVVGVVFGTLLAVCLMFVGTWAAVIGALGSGFALAALLAWQYDDPGREDGLFPPGREGRNPFDDSGG